MRNVFSCRLLAQDSRTAVSMLSSPNLAQQLKAAVQKLGTACIELVKVAGQRRAHPGDERIRREITEHSNVSLSDQDAFR